MDVVSARGKPICADGSVPQCDATCADGTNPPCAKVTVAPPCGRNRHYSISMWALTQRCGATCADVPRKVTTTALPCGQNWQYRNQCCVSGSESRSGSTRSKCFWASWIRSYLYHLLLITAPPLGNLINNLVK
jgi:hypothetical protein